jgi:hypothetical protein
MHAKLNDWKNNWYGIELSLDPVEIDLLIDQLHIIKQDSEQHFHISSDYKDSCGLGDIEISQKSKEQKHNMSLGGKAMSPGDSI